MNNTDFHKRLQALSNGANYVKYHDKRYLLRKETLLHGKLIKVYAEELGGNDIVSGNYYTTIKDGLLKPCEMSDKKVIDFVLRAEECIK
ncbi:MAG TPA: peptide methionine sulfoxide reductase [Campylobacterales bacterium]|nr:peptide methionine sulfoxide reductase [Campylobacterales bacterium]HHS93205.1 peptide methionine sulfoxide reductase [Campylobacterales bacterium]